MRRWGAIAACSAVVTLTALSGPAQAQDCTGISQASAAVLTTVRIASGLNRPVFVTSPPGDVSRLFVLEQNGTIRIVKNGALLATPFLDLSALVFSPADGGGAEEGLLGMAFDPAYAASGAFFLFHTANAGADNLVVRYQRDAVNPDLADPASRQIVLAIPHPSFGNHNGGMIAFGPDGYLYVGSGDGGSSCDPPGNAQSGASLLGKILRLDVATVPYAIPPDNPFAGPDGFLDEIWAYGLRNPWRFDFDSATGDLFIGDVGQWQREEVDYQPGGSPGGENYGWDLYEGADCPNPSCGSITCTVPRYAAPVISYAHTNGNCSVTGGPVYRGCRMPDLHGTYFYADYCSEAIASFRMAGGVVTDFRDRSAELQPGGGLALGEITSWGTDARGEIYLADLGGTVPVIRGEIYKVVPVLSALEVSGAGAAPFLLAQPGGDWIWEDLASTSAHPIAAYRIYRSAGNGSGAFACVGQQAGTSWSGGDPAFPAARQLFSYLVTAVDAAGQETSPGTGTGGIVRSLLADPCPP